MTTPVTPPVTVQEHSWLPKASCDTSCIRVDAVHVSRPVVVILRTTVRLIMTMLLLPALPLLAYAGTAVFLAVHPAHSPETRVEAALLLGLPATLALHRWWSSVRQ